MPVNQIHADTPCAQEKAAHDNAMRALTAAVEAGNAASENRLNIGWEAEQAAYDKRDAAFEEYQRAAVAYFECQNRQLGLGREGED